MLESRWLVLVQEREPGSLYSVFAASDEAPGHDLGGLCHPRTQMICA